MSLTRTELLEALTVAAERKTYRAKDFFEPVTKQLEFFNLGAKVPERMLMAGNGNGKTESAAYEVACHMTGEYPPWWKGYRFNKPVRVWAAGTSTDMVREGGQTKLCGPPGEEGGFGQGMIPKEAFVGKPAAARGTADAIDSFQVRHKSGGISRLVFKTYVQERRHWQGADIDLFWPDEEPPLAIYTEGMARLRGRGISLMTFTPLMGMSEVVCRFLENDDPLRGYVKMGIKDALWYSEEERARMVASYPANEREARANGDPLLGSGKVYTTPAEDLMIDPVAYDRVPLHWPKIWGIDFGIDHPFAAVLMAWDREYDTYYILATVRMTNSIPLQHAQAIRAIASNVPVAWPHDGHHREKGSGEELALHYRKLKDVPLNMLSTHATHASGGYSVYAGVTELDTAMRAGRFKVVRSLSNWFEEYGQYHYKDNQIVKVKDDLLDATRCAWMMIKRYGRAVPLGAKIIQRDRGNRLLDGADRAHFGY